jgi:predicted transcriptional regulator
MSRLAWWLTPNMQQGRLARIGRLAKAVCLRCVSFENGGCGVATSLKIDDALKGRVQQLAKLQRRSAHWVMCAAIQQYVEREEASERFKQEALVSWVAYQETGRHLSGQEVHTWLKAWGAGAEKEMPECHE